MISESKKKQIEKEAKQILDKFSSALKKVKIKKEDLKPVDFGFRQEGNGETCDNEFRKKIFANAPKTEGDCIMAEKRKWQK